MAKICSVMHGSRAEKSGICAGDDLRAINGRVIHDVLDYRFFLAEKSVELLLYRPTEDREFRAIINKGEYDDIGLEFETPLMDKKHSCENKCIFCFIDQLPKGMRQTLYFKDDDSRLSFLHGNYITLTNLHDEDIDRIIEMHISPVNVSVHTTDPELRVKMTHNKRAGEVLSYLDRMARAGIKLCCQIVLCKGINDGEALKKTMADLYRLYPALSSVSIVPAGLTRYRQKLYPLESYTRDEGREVIRTVDEFAEKCKRETGTRLFFCADELYLESDLPIPNDGYYEEYSQIENGVGMIRTLTEEFNTELEFLDEYLEEYKCPRHVSIATGAAAYDTIKSLCSSLEARVEGLTVDVYKIRNDFFGETITVSGLLVGQDIRDQLAGRDLGELLLIPRNALRADGDVMLDDMSPEALSETLGTRVLPSGESGADLIHAIMLG